jgi:hypothetical protein
MLGGMRAAPSVVGWVGWRWGSQMIPALVDAFITMYFEIFSRTTTPVTRRNRPNHGIFSPSTTFATSSSFLLYYLLCFFAKPRINK